MLVVLRDPEMLAEFRRPKRDVRRVERFKDVGSVEGSRDVGRVEGSRDVGRVGEVQRCWQSWRGPEMLVELRGPKRDVGRVEISKRDVSRVERSEDRCWQRKESGWFRHKAKD